MAATVAATANVLKIAAVLGAVEDLRPKRLPEHALTVPPPSAPATRASLAYVILPAASAPTVARPDHLFTGCSRCSQLSNEWTAGGNLSWLVMQLNETEEHCTMAFRWLAQTDPCEGEVKCEAHLNGDR